MSANHPKPGGAALCWLALASAALGGAATAQEGGAGPPALRAEKPVQLRSAGGENVKPFLAARPDGGIYLAWAQQNGQRTAAWFTRSRDGLAFDAPVRLSTAEMDLDLGAENGPNLAVGPDGAVYAVWVAGSWAASAPRPAPTAGQHGGSGGGHPPRPGHLNIYLARSTDDGATFSKPARVNDDTGGAEHRFPAVVVEPGGAVDVVWLDKRKQNSQRPDFARVFFARSTDGGRTFAANADATSGQEYPICHCCKIGLAAHPRAGLRIAFRNDVDDLRDMFLIRAAAGGATFAPPVPLEQTGWRIPSCPMNGPTLAFDPAGDLHAVWMTGGSVDGAPLVGAATQPFKILYRRIAGESGSAGPPHFVACGSHATMAVNTQGQVFVAWKGDGITLARLPGGAGTAATILRLSAGPGAADFPALAVGANGQLFAAWQQEDAKGARQVYVSRVLQEPGPGNP